MAAAIQKTSRVARWRNGLALRLPQEGVEELGLKEGDSVHICIGNGAMTIRRVKQRKKWTEAELLKGVTSDICGPDLISDRAGRELI